MGTEIELKFHYPRLKTVISIELHTIGGIKGALPVHGTIFSLFHPDKWKNLFVFITVIDASPTRYATLFVPRAECN